MLCIWSSAILFLRLCRIYQFTCKMMKNIMNAEPKCVGALGNCLSKIISPHLQSLFIMVVIHIYYFPSSLCTAWQCSIALVAGEAGTAKGNTERLMSFCTSRLPLTFHQAGTSPSFPSPDVGYFFFLLLRWIRPGFKVLISTHHWACKSLWGIPSCWKVALERWRLEVMVWYHRSFLSEAASWILKSARDRGLTQQGDTQGSMGTLCFQGRFWSHHQHLWLKSNSDVTTLSFQVRCIAMSLCFRHQERPASSVNCGIRELLGWMLWSAKCTMSFSTELRVQSRAVISKERTQCCKWHLARQAKV